MASSININGFKEYADALQKASNGLVEMADMEADVAAENIATGARSMAPLNDGALRASINKDGKDGKYEVFASANYAAYVEFGTRKKVQIPAGLEQYAAQFKGPGGGSAEDAKAAIYEWCRKKGIPEDNWWGVFIGIMTQGIKAHPFLFPSVDEEQPKFFERLKNILNNL